MEKHWLEHVENSRDKIANASGNLQELVSFSDPEKMGPMTYNHLLQLIDTCDRVVRHLNSIIAEEKTIV